MPLHLLISLILLHFILWLATPLSNIPPSSPFTFTLPCRYLLSIIPFTFFFIDLMFFFSGNWTNLPNARTSCGPGRCPARCWRTDPLPPFSSQVQFVMDAVYSFAYALSNLQKSMCPGVTHVCEAMNTYDGGDFYREYLLNVSFRSEYRQTMLGDSRVYIILYLVYIDMHGVPWYI